MHQARRRGLGLPSLLPWRPTWALSLLVVAMPAIGPPPVRKHTHRRPRVHRATVICANANRPAGDLSLGAARAAVVCLINHERTERGLPSMAESAKLDHSAQSWTDHMVATADFSHGTRFSARITVAGYAWQMAGENIAAGQATPHAVVKAWMASDGHCHNILEPEFRDLGAGMSTTAVPAWQTEPVTWTTDFGLSASESAASHNMGPANGCPYGGG